MRLKLLTCLASFAFALSTPLPVYAQISDAQLDQYRQRGARLGLTPEQVTQVFRFIDSNEGVIVRAARQNSVNEQAFRAIALELGLRNYGGDPDLLIEAIVERAEGAARYETQIGNLRSLVSVMQNTAARTPAEVALARADAAYQSGDLDGAEAALEELIDLRSGELVEAYEAWEAAHRAVMELARTRDDIERVDQLATRAREARRLQRERQAAADRKADWLDQIDRANVRYDRGRLRGNNTALEEAIAIYRDEALPLVDRAADRDDWASTQHDLGIALRTLGSRESGTARLEEAVSAHRLALEERTRERVPLDWAKTQNNLGIALWTLGSRESGSARLEEAVSAYRLALEESTRERVPLDWALTQSNLGAALETLGSRESGTARLEEAVSAYRLALEEMTRERVPLDWAKTQNNLGIALDTLGSRESGTARLEEAVSAYRLALEERTRERVPLDWAKTQNNLGAALWTLGSRESGTARLEEAVSAYRLALEEMTRERVPLDWAATQNNLGIALAALGSRESGTARLEEAVSAYRLALEEWTRERVPLDWAKTQNNLGAALETLGSRESGTARLEEAVSAYRLALEERTRERVPLYWAATQNNLGIALAALGSRESGTARLKEAVAAFRLALEERTRERVPFDWARTQNNLGAAHTTLGSRESGVARLEEAVIAYRLALEEWTRERVPLYWAQSSYFGALALLELARRSEESTLQTEARSQLEEVRDWADAVGHGVYYRSASARIAELNGQEYPKERHNAKPEGTKPR